VEHNAFFKRLDTILRARQARRGKEQLPLSLDRYLADRERSRLESDSLEALQKLSTGLTATPLASLNPAVAADSVEREKVRDWKEQLSKDAYLREAVDVLGDWATTKR
jgi:carboxyl-terminal processing protease